MEVQRLELIKVQPCFSRDRERERERGETLPAPEKNFVLQHIIPHQPDTGAKASPQAPGERGIWQPSPRWIKRASVQHKQAAHGEPVVAHSLKGMVCRLTIQ